MIGIAQKPGDDVAALVAACHRGLWRQRVVAGSGRWLLPPAVLIAILAMVHRSAVELSAGWTLPLAATAVLIAVIGRVHSSRPSTQQALLEADRVASADMLIASAWSLASADSWCARKVLGNAQAAARDARVQVGTRFVGQPDLMSRIAIVIFAVALLVLALPGKPRDQALAAAVVAPPAFTAAAPIAADALPDRSRRDHAGLQARSIPIPTPDRVTDGRLAEGDEGATANDAAGTGSPDGGDAASGDSGEKPPAPMPAAAALQESQHVDIRRRGQRSAASAAATGQDQPAATQGNVAAASAANGDVPAPPVDIGPAMRNFLSTWERGLEAAK